jgi:transposase
VSKIKEVIRMGVKHNYSAREIGRAQNISHTCASNYLARYKDLEMTLEEFEAKTDQEVENLFKTEPPKTDKRREEMEKQFPEFQAKLTRKGETLQRLWDGYRASHPDALGYSQFCLYYQAWNNSLAVWMRMEHKTGDKMSVDFTGEKLQLTDRLTGEKRDVETFLAVLGCSQYGYMEFVESQRKEHWIKCNVNALWYFGGVPAAIVPDNLKSAVNKASRYEPWLNETYLDFARHYDTTILPARPRRATDKAIVEGFVRLIYQRVYAGMRDEIFYDIDDMNARAWELLEKHNNREFQQKDGSRRSRFEEIEKQALKSLPAESFVLKERQKCTVWQNYHVKLKDDEHWYSVPCRYAGKHCKMLYTGSLVEIYLDNERIAMHERVFGRHQYTTLTEHMPANHQFVAGMTPDRIVSWAEGIGSSTRMMAEKIMAACRHPQQGFNSCLGILNLNRKYSNVQVEKACARALSFNAHGYGYVKSILEKKLEETPADQTQEDIPLPFHENIRGSEYFQ